jgi:hypothetical protein
VFKYEQANVQETKDLSLNTTLSATQQNGVHDSFSLPPFIWGKGAAHKNVELAQKHPLSLDTALEDLGIVKSICTYWDIGQVFQDLAEANVLCLNLSSSLKYWFHVARLFGRLELTRYGNPKLTVDEDDPALVGFTQFEVSWLIRSADLMLAWALKCLLNYRTVFGAMQLNKIKKRVRKLKPRQVPTLIRQRAQERKDIVTSIPTGDELEEHLSRHAKRRWSVDEIEEGNVEMIGDLKFQQQVKAHRSREAWIAQEASLIKRRRTTKQILVSYLHTLRENQEFSHLQPVGRLAQGDGFTQCAQVVAICWRILDSECDLPEKKSAHRTLRTFIEPMIQNHIKRRFVRMLATAEEATKQKEALDASDKWIPKHGLKSPFQFTFLAQYIVNDSQLERRVRQTYLPEEFNFWSTVAINCYWECIVDMVEDYMTYQLSTACLAVLPTILKETVEEKFTEATAAQFTVRSYTMTKKGSNRLLRIEVGISGDKHVEMALGLQQVSRSDAQCALNQTCRDVRVKKLSQTATCTVVMLSAPGGWDMASTDLQQKISKVIPRLRSEGALILYRKVILLYRLLFVKSKLSAEAMRKTRLRDFFAAFVNIWLSAGEKAAAQNCPDPIKAGKLDDPDWAIDPKETNTVVKILETLSRASEEQPCNPSQVYRFAGISGTVLSQRVEAFAHFIREEITLHTDATTEALQKRAKPKRGLPPWRVSPLIEAGFSHEFPDAGFISRFNQSITCERKLYKLLCDMQRRNPQLSCAAWTPFDIYLFCLERKLDKATTDTLVDLTSDNVQFRLDELTEEAMTENGLSVKRSRALTAAIRSLDTMEPYLSYHPTFVRIERINYDLMLRLTDGFVTAFDFALAVERVIWQPVENLLSIMAHMEENKDSMRETIVPNSSRRSMAPSANKRESKFARGGGQRQSFVSKKELDKLDLGLVEHMEPDMVLHILDTDLFDPLRTKLNDFIEKGASNIVLARLCSMMQHRLFEEFDLHLRGKHKRQKLLTLAQIARVEVALNAVRDLFMDFGTHTRAIKSYKTLRERQVIHDNKKHVYTVAEQVDRTRQLCGMLQLETATLIKLFQIYPKPKVQKTGFLSSITESKTAGEDDDEGGGEEAQHRNGVEVKKPAHVVAALNISKRELWKILNARYIQEMPTNLQCVNAKKFIKGHTRPPPAENAYL